MTTLTLITALPVLAAPPDDAGPAAGPPWIMILVGLAIGIGIGMVIVARAKRRYPPVQGPGPERREPRRPGGRRGNGAEKSDRG